MRKFKEELYKMGYRSKMMLFWMLFWLYICFLLIFLLGMNPIYMPFDSTMGGNQTMEVTVLMGPFVEEGTDTETFLEYYVAESPEGYWSILAVEPGCSLPVYGVDVNTEEEITQLTPQTIKGKNQKIDFELSEYLVEFFEGTNHDITLENYTEFFGTYYMDASNTAVDSVDMMLMLMVTTGIFVPLLGYFLILNIKAKKNIGKKLKELRRAGKFAIMYRDCMNGKGLIFKAVNLVITENYVLDLTKPEKEIQVIDLAGIRNVYVSFVNKGGPNARSCIVLENETEKYHIGAYESNYYSRELAKVVEQLKLWTKEAVE